MDTMTFTDMIAKSYAFNKQVYLASGDWQRVKELYLLNEPDDIERLPKRIHQVWLGSPVPDCYRKYMSSWQRYHPTWDYYVWTDVDVKSIEITNRAAFDRAQNPAMRSDILRYEILRQYGGLYVDTDFECLRPFDDLLYLNFFTGISYDSVLQLYNGLIACRPNHPIINDCVKINTTYDGNKGSRIINETGAYHFTRCFLRNITNKTVAFPMDYFYPYPNSLKGAGDPYSFVTDKTYALHHWAVSWTKKGRKQWE